LDVATGQPLADTLRWCKFSGAAWTHDGRGFFYARYPAPPPGSTYAAKNTDPQFCYHVIGTDQREDRVVYERPDQPEWSFQGTVPGEGRGLTLDPPHAPARRNRGAWIDLEHPGVVVRPLLMDFDATYESAGGNGNVLFSRPARGPSRSRIVAIDRARPDR